jgi:predicted transcriptional regulator
MRKCIIVLVSLAFLGGLAQAREIFVEQKHAQASDKNDGSEAKPLQTISAAVVLAKPGDVIWVKAGMRRRC